MRSPIRRLFFVFLMLAGVLHPAVVAADQAPVPPGDAPLEVTAIVLRYFPPQFYLNRDAQPVGFAIDVLNQVAELAGLRVRYVVKNTWQEAVESLRRGEGQLIPNMALLPQWQREFEFSLPVEVSPVSIFVLKTNQDIRKTADLAGHKVAAVEFNLPYEVFQPGSRVTLEVFDSYLEGLFHLLAGDVDAFVYPQTTLESLTQRIGVDHRIQTVDRPLGHLTRAMALAPGQAELRQRLDAALARFVGSPAYQQTYRKWYAKPRPFWTVGRVTWAMTALLVLALVCMALWRYRSMLALNHHLLENIAVRRSAETALRDSEEKYRQVVDNANEAILVVQKGAIQFANPVTQALTGYGARELARRPFLDLVHPDDRQVAAAGQEQPASGGQSYRLLDRQGQERWVQVNAVEIAWEQAPASLLLARDVTRQRSLEAQARQRQKIEDLGALAGSVAHDFNKALGIIHNNLEMALEETPPDTLSQRALQRSLQATQRSKDLVRQILTFRRLGSTPHHPMELELAVEDSLRQIGGALPAGARLSAKLEAPGRLILGDATQVHQALFNLCLNAAQALGHQGGSITVSLDPVDLAPGREDAPPGLAPGAYLLLCVADDGPGMAPEVLAKIFDPFFTTKRPDEGSGLGLSVVQGIVQSHGGQISVRSQLGQGTVFRLWWPEHQGQGAPTEDAPAQPPAAGPGSTEPAPSFTLARSAAASLLLVDDDQEFLRTQEDLLRRAGYQVRTASDPRQALELVGARPRDFDLVISDLNMPGLDGLELSRRLLALRPDLPVWLCTGHGGDLDQAALDSAGVRRLLDKAESGNELARAIVQALGPDNPAGATKTE